MKAAVIHRTGPPESIEYIDLTEPEPGPTEVLVKVGAVAVNPVDTYIRSGVIGMPLEFPYIIGADLAGTVERCGSEVTRFQPGDRVWGTNQGFFGQQGTFAERVAVDEQWLYPTPDEESDAEAAAGALVGITAHMGLFLHGGLTGGEVVFVNGGTGGVGHAVVQLAKAAGARVVTTVGSEEKRKLCQSWKADTVLDYHSPRLDDEIRRYVDLYGGIHLWYETLREPTFERTIDLLAPRGRMIMMAGRDARPEFPVGPFYVKDLRLIGFAMFNGSPEELRQAAMTLNALYDAGTWRPHIGKTFPLAEAAEAHKLQEGKTLQGTADLAGKIVLQP